MESIWENTSNHIKFNGLKRNIKTDVLIIGGGICGVLCAYMLNRAGINYTLVEASAVGSGVTKNTTAKITSQHGFIYDKLIRTFGIERAKQYLNANEAAVQKYREICKDIDCDFEDKAAYTYCTDNRCKPEKEIEALKKLNFAAQLVDTVPLPFSVAGAVKFSNQAQFNPLKFISAISEQLNICENTRVRELIGTTAVTNNGTIDAEKIIVATHFPFINKHGSYFIKLYQHRSYVIALSNAEYIDGMFVDEAQSGMSFRMYKDMLLIGGGDHRTGKKGGGWQELRDFAKLHYPEAKEHFHWATQDCMSLDSVPYIGQYSANTNNMFVATGFNKWGMSSSMAAAMILTDLIQGKNNPYAQIFSPSRSILHPQLAVNAFETVTSLITPTTKRCPHLGCALKWNPYEHTWDCPCHGSRFTSDGHLIDNPATGDIKK